MKNYFDLTDRVAVVTGASTGLGVQMAKALANQGCNIVCLARRQANVEANAFRQPPKWLEYDANNMIVKVVGVPAREDIDLPIEEHLIVELYSK